METIISSILNIAFGFVVVDDVDDGHGIPISSSSTKDERPINEYLKFTF